MIERFIAAAQDPGIVPGVHHYCDEWCHYCPMTRRCLAFKCLQIHRALRARASHDPDYLDLEEAAEVTRLIRVAEGSSTEDLDAVLGGQRLPWKECANDPLLGLAFGYAAGAEFVVKPTVDDLRRWMRAPKPPEPRQVVVYYHMRIYMKLVRAVVADARTRAGTADRREDALGCAKLVLVSIERSRTALRTLMASGTGGIPPLLDVLDAVEAGIDERLPGARAFVRIGLDLPAAA